MVALFTTYEVLHERIEQLQVQIQSLKSNSSVLQKNFMKFYIHYFYHTVQVHDLLIELRKLCNNWPLKTLLVLMQQHVTFNSCKHFCTVCLEYDLTS